MIKNKLTLEKLLAEALVPEEEQPYKVPENWVWTNIKSINKFKNNNIDPRKFAEEIFELYSVPSYPDGTPEIVKGQEIGSNKQIVNTDNILLCKINPRINRVWKVAEKRGRYKQLASTEWIVIENKRLYPAYLLYFLKSPYFRKKLTSNVSGVGGSLTRARPKEVEKYPIAIPPLNEQKRIAEKVERLLSKIDEAKQLVEEVKKTFELRRAAILDKAFSGELTRKWREENSIDQSVNELLEKIRIEKESIYLRLLDKANKEGTKKPARPKKFQSEINHEYAKSLPNQWGYCTLGDVIYDFKYGTSEKSDYGFEGTPVIRIPNIGEEYINSDDLKYLKDNSIDFNASVLVGDILIVRSNGSKDLVGKCSIVQKGEEKYAFASYLIRIRPILVVPEFILWLLKSDRVREQFFSKSKSSAGINNINTEELATTVIPLPPIEEQREIVQKLKAVIAKEDEIKKILDLDNYVRALKQSILSKAFRGELGTNDPSEENAIELLKAVLQEQMK